MEWYRLTVILHLLGAAVWVGGHLVLSLAILPGALRARDVRTVRDFEARYERLGIPSLALQVITGLVLAGWWVRDLGQLLPPATPQAVFLLVKLGLLAATVAIAVDARVRIIPTLDERSLPSLAYHAFAVTILGVMMVVMGVAVRTGGLA